MERTPWPPTVAATAEGNRIDFADPDPEQITLIAITRGLSQTCRFAGQSRSWYSVAEHSVRVALRVAEQNATEELVRAAFMHDAHEAFTGDLVRPLRHLLPELTTIQTLLDDAICRRFDIDPDLLTHPAVQHADNVQLSIEGRLLLPGCDHEWPTNDEPSREDKMQYGWPPGEAAMRFRRFGEKVGLAWG